MENKNFSAQSVAVHGGAIQQCLNGALVSVKNSVDGKWELFGAWEFYDFSPDFSYRTKATPGAPAIESPALDVSIREWCSEREFTCAQLKAHGAVIAWYLRGGSVQWRRNDEQSWQEDDGSGFCFIPEYQYRIAEEPKACKCDICETTPLPPGWKFEPSPKTPLGVEPEYIWVEKRIAELRAAVSRQIIESSAEAINWRLVANWSNEILERQAQLSQINK